jgi:hypothetical protein
MSEIKIVVPSHKRSEILTTNVYNQILCIHENEKKDYEKYDCEKIYHNLNSLSKIRQFIYDKFGDVFMIDDDIVSVEKLYTDIDVKLSSLEVYQLIQETYYNSKQVNAKLFGFNNTLNPKHYKPQKPFVANGYINACAFGLIKDKNLYFSPKTTACESHWINLLNAYYNRYSFQDTRFAFRQKSNSTFILDGGQTLKRTIETEKKDTLFLKMMFGDSIQLKKGQNDSKLHHKYQRKLNIKL